MFSNSKKSSKILSAGCIAILLACVLFFTTTLFAQSLGFGAISGIVQDSTGAVVSDAKVVVENAGKGIRREMQTTSGGVFNAPALVPAAGYSVKVTKAGFADYVAKDIIVNVGQNVDISAVLKVGGTGTAVEVTGELPVVDTTKTDTSAVVGQQQIMDLPINGRRVDSFVLLTPGVASDGSFGLISFRGNAGGNNFLTDGNDTTNSFYDENAGRTRTYNISQDAVQEFQVVSSNFLAEYGKASGGVINTVTKSGSNSYHGSAFEFWRNQSLSATDPTSGGINPDEHRHQFGGSLGGPIVKDKLFFFGNVELQRRDAPIVSSNINNSTLFNPDGTVKAGQCVVNAVNGPTQAQCDAAAAYLTSRVAPQLIPRNMNVNLFFGKIDWRPTERDSFSFSGNYLDFESPNGIQTQLSLTSGDGIGNNATTTVKNRTARMSYTRIFTPTLLNEFRFGYFKDRQFDPASESLIPTVNGTPTRAAFSISGTQNVSNIGYANGYPRLNPSENRFQYADTLTYTRGRHTFKFGADYAQIEDYVSRLANQFGTYTYSSLNAFALDFSAGPNADKKNWQTYTQAFGNPVIVTNVKEFSMFAQDQWRVLPKLSLDLGVRYDWTGIPTPGITNPASAATGIIPSSPVNIAPRIGFAYSLTEKTVIRGGYGIFHNRYPTSTIENLLLSNGVIQSTYSLNGTTAAQEAAGPIFPNNLAATPSLGAAATSIVVAAPNFRNAYSQQATLAVEREILKNTSLSVSYVWSRSLHMLQTRNANLTDPNLSCTEGVVGPTAEGCYGYPIYDSNAATATQVGIYTTPIYRTSNRINSAFDQISQLNSSGNSYYNGLLVNLTKRTGKWFTGTAAYTYSHAIDYSQGGGGNTLFGSTFPTTAVVNGNFEEMKGSSSIDQRHRFIANALFTPTFTNRTSGLDRYLINNWQFSLTYLLASSQPLVPTISVGTNLNSSTIPAAQRIPLYKTSTLSGLGGSFRVPFESISGLNIGNIYKADMRLTKRLPFSERFTGYVMFEAFNVFNTTVPGGPGPRNATHYTTALKTIGTSSIVALVPNPAYGTLLQTQAPPDGTTARRAQLGFRLTF